MISVIVPVYNVATLLPKCVNSVLLQTYNDLQLILVNDGSTDDSLDICNYYSKKDNRVLVITQDNAGLSAARNRGLDFIKGEYIFFLDSDDYLEETTLQQLIDEAMLSNADIVACGLLAVYGDSKERVENSKVIFKRDYSSPKSSFFLQDISNHACGKLYRSSLFFNPTIYYPVGRTYEDIATSYKLFTQAKIVSYTNAGLYKYYQNPNSITNYTTMDKINDLLITYYEINEYFFTHYKNYECTKYYQLTILFTIYSRLCASKSINKVEYKQISTIIRNEFIRISKKVNLIRYINSPFGKKIILYKYHLAGPLIHLRKLLYVTLKKE